MPDDLSPLPDDKEIEARFAKLREGLTPGELIDADAKLAEIISKTEAERIEEAEHQAYLDKLAGLESRLDSVRAKAEKVKDPSSVSGSVDRGTAVGMGYGLTLAYTIIGTPILGFGVGLLLNKALNTNGWQIWLTLLGGIIGIGWVSMVATRNANRF